MRILLTTLVMALSLTNGAKAADPVEAPTDTATVQLGEGLVLSRPVYQQLVMREDGWAIIERMQQRAADTRRFEGMPPLILIFASVLLLFWSAMFYYNRKHARLHRTIQLMVEKGQPPPVELLRAAEQLDAGSEAPRVAPAPPWASNLMWGGVLWITVGVSGSIYLWTHGSEAWPWGLAAIAYGAAAAATAYRKRDSR